MFSNKRIIYCTTEEMKSHLTYCRENRHLVTCQADVGKLKEYNFKTPLQKAIQLLKRHRDIMFENDTKKLKPISIIITTLAAELYNDEDNVVDTLTNILTNIEAHLKRKMVGGVYHVKSKIVNNCARGLYTHFMFNLYAFGSRTERSGERLPKAARGSVKVRNATVEQLLGSQIKLRNLVVAVAERSKIRAFRS